MYKIKELPSSQQPRERLIELGPESLSLDELLSIILGTGYKGENVLQLSQRIFNDYGTKAILGYRRVEDIMLDFSLPKVKSCQVLACFEIGKRMFQSNGGNIPTIHSPQDVWEYVSDMYTLKKEYLRGLYLNVKNQIIYDEVISIGTIDQSIAHPRDIFSPALKYHASAIIVVHNHPSGDVTPSQADKELTRRLQEIGNIMSIPVLDHIIVSSTEFKSI
jgi:DNA repair protein RadC